MERIKKSKFLKPIIQLTAGSAIAQVITILISPVSTRLFSSEQLGTYTMILTVVSIFGPVLAGRYDMSIVTSKNKEDEVNLISASFFISIAVTFMVSASYFVYLIKQKNILEETGSSIFYLIPILLLMTAVTNILTAYNNKYKEYRLISKVYVLRNVVQNSSLIIFGFLKLGSLGLICSQVLSVLFGVKEQSLKLIENKKEFRLVSLSGMKKILFSEKKQPIFSVPATLLNSSSYSILNFFITGLFGLNVFGYYSMSYRILGLPLTLISTNVSKVFFQQASEERKIIGNYRKVLIKFTFVLLFISIPMVIFLMIFSPVIFEFFFGKGWYVSGIYVRILAPMFGIRLVVSSVAVSLIISQKQQLELLLQFAFIVLSLVSYFLCKILNLDEYIFFSLISFSYSLVYLFYYYIIYKLSGKESGILND
ncbi:hypothetical protein CKN99_12750 [Carnobacterium maltaromaticum]|uniref:lipopolysaccharide biosynthesis protein n=1 Tax=Carnobacterium maltaromaticum TaxID=2751 RepID=UPI001072B8D3|nr:oligosaccharide flippase family protein [Carnobacterium maltaromaticum]TFJ24165.1 hypothetical protein CKN90_12710 [Carnobacterium maltaromaticum]TFJ29570.1 hypothetical protein CKN98_12715 [Carnobacterium maltaromaticum]TFJ32708.1 hypothetical protein CKN88_12670 [Carnobacterium maltaromaticum]TFJ34824.1 hypothetical protein CKN99_12750 [Carnobacterium maltaromaticum]TFJ42013.1 hypothetical protein CKN92_12185 [Carnobacterium maltaromaticum]